MGAARGGAAGDGAERRMEQEDGDVSPEQAEQEAAAIYCGDCISREAREGGSRSRRRQQRRAPPPSSRHGSSGGIKSGGARRRRQQQQPSRAASPLSSA
ncbi:unnamed protein product [Lampetra planeri]